MPALCATAGHDNDRGRAAAPWPAPPPTRRRARLTVAIAAGHRRGPAAAARRQLRWGTRQLRRALHDGGDRALLGLRFTHNGVGSVAYSTLSLHGVSVADEGSSLGAHEHRNH
ncbi:hypothetical protein EAD89_03685 [Micromonospora sp. BL4]|nr:hypothetical protein EAD89_03685 [Micromonospora sp. BL4]